MANIEEITRFISYLQYKFPVSPGEELTKADIALLERRFSQIEFSILEKASKLLQNEISKFPSIATILETVDRVEELELKDPLGDILTLISRCTSDTKNWPKNTNPIFFQILNRLGGTEAITQLKESDLVFKRKEVRNLFLQFRRDNRALGIPKELERSTTDEASQEEKQHLVRGYQAIESALVNRRELEEEMNKLNIMPIYRPKIRAMYKAAITSIPGLTSSAKDRMIAESLDIPLKDFLEKGFAAAKAYEKKEKTLYDYKPGSFAAEFAKLKKEVSKEAKELGQILAKEIIEEKKNLQKMKEAAILKRNQAKENSTQGDQTQWKKGGAPKGAGKENLSPNPSQSESSRPPF